MHTNKNKSYELSYASVICMNNETRLELTIQLRCLLFCCVLLSPAWMFFFDFFSFIRSLWWLLLLFIPYHRDVNTFYSLLVCCLSGVGEWFGVLCVWVCVCVVFVRLPESRAHLLNLLRILITRSSRACIPFHRQMCLPFDIRSQR